MSFLDKFFGTYALSEQEFNHQYKDISGADIAYTSYPKEEIKQHWLDPTKAALLIAKDEPSAYKCKHGITTYTGNIFTTSPEIIKHFSIINCPACRNEFLIEDYCLGPEIKCPNHKLLEKC